ncbi:unnamed protein product [Rotaria sp. Silwood1]|nr:unnamed protein product [Rotaria sp. Silwood1]
MLCIQLVYLNHRQSGARHYVLLANVFLLVVVQHVHARANQPRSQVSSAMIFRPTAISTPAQSGMLFHPIAISTPLEDNTSTIKDISENINHRCTNSHIGVLNSTINNQQHLVNIAPDNVEYLAYSVIYISIRSFSS